MKCEKDSVDLIRQGKQNGWNISYFPVEVEARGVLSESLGAFFRFMGLARRKASQAADNVGKVRLQASYTLWLSRNQPNFSRWTLVEKPQLQGVPKVLQHHIFYGLCPCG